MDDIGKTITNTILPISLRALQSFCRAAVVGHFRVFPYRVALFPWIRIGLYIVGKNKFKRLFQPNQPQRRRRCKIIITRKTRALLVVVQTYRSFFSRYYVWIKDSKVKASLAYLPLPLHYRYQTNLKIAKTLFTNPSIGGEGYIVRLPNDDISDEIPRFASVQSNSIA